MQLVICSISVDAAYSSEHLNILSPRLFTRSWPFLRTIHSFCFSVEQKIFILNEIDDFFLLLCARHGIRNSFVGQSVLSQ